MLEESHALFVHGVCYNTGVPKKPDEAEYSIEENGVMVKWTPSSQDPNPVMGYVIEGLDDGKWNYDW